MSSIEFEGRAVRIEAGDTLASALYRSGVRTFSRSFKFHRRRGLYCCTGDCSNCLVTVDAEPAVRACVTAAQPGQKVARSNAWPSADFDVLNVLWRVRFLFPVGFYYKSMIRPRWLFRRLEPLIRRIAGLGSVPLDAVPEPREQQHHHVDVLVIGGGAAGLSAAHAAADSGASVLLVDEGVPGEQLSAGATRTRVEALLSDLRRRDGAVILERALAVAVYEGPLVPVAAEDALHMVHPARVIVASGAVERHVVFPGSDLPGVWLGRGAARLAGVHGLSIGRRLLVAASTEEGLDHLATLRAAGCTVVAVLAPASLADRVAPGVRVITDGEIVSASGRRAVRGAVIRSGLGTERIRCDAIVASLGFVARDGLLRQCQTEPVVGAGDVIMPGAGLDAACASGRTAGRGGSAAVLPPALPLSPAQGFVCLCEDVTTSELDAAWSEGYQSTELLKRYCTATMGPCQGAMCHPHLQSFVRQRSPQPQLWSGPTTARPPARPVRLEDVAAGIDTAVELRTALHERHVALGAELEWAGAWKRPRSYGDVLGEYWAVRRGVSVMDVGTLGKYRVAGPDATAFLERLYPCSVGDIAPGRLRYALLLNEAGYVFDDGLICSLGAAGYYLTFTSGGADHAEAWMREWAGSWKLQVHIANVTATLGAINVAGPSARALLERLTRDPVDAASLRYSNHRRIEVAGVPCHVLRVGFVGELSFELHHPAMQSAALWDALLEAGRELDVRPHGLDAVRLLRLEKMHVIVGQDTDFDATPQKLGMAWAVRSDKPDFLGRTALERIAGVAQERRLAAIAFHSPDAPVEGAQLLVGGVHVGRVTSSRFSPVLGHGVALGWVRVVDGAFPTAVEAVGPGGERHAGTIVAEPFYDPKGVRLRA